MGIRTKSIIENRTHSEVNRNKIFSTCSPESESKMDFFGLLSVLLLEGVATSLFTVETEETDIRDIGVVGGLQDQIDCIIYIQILIIPPDSL